MLMALPMRRKPWMRVTTQPNQKQQLLPPPYPIPQPLLVALHQGCLEPLARGRARSERQMLMPLHLRRKPWMGVTMQPNQKQ